MKKSLSLSIGISEELNGYYKGDAFRLRQILTNLIGNSVKYTEEGSITLEVRRLKTNQPGYTNVEFAVTDTGIGIPEDKLSILFDDFSQIDSSNTREYGGSGLGLAIVKNLVQLMGGEVAVESILGAGSCFSFNCLLENTSTMNSSNNSNNVYKGF